MRAETGSLGRALGFAGIFVIPGAGVASAEDVQEAMTQGTPPAQAAPENAGPAAPAEAPVRTPAEQQAETDEQLRARAQTLYRTLSEDSPERAQEFGAWMTERKMRSFTDAKGAALRGAVRKLEKLHEAAQQSIQQAPTEEPATDER
jgi:hypothetical protein